MNVRFTLVKAGLYDATRCNEATFAERTQPSDVACQAVDCNTRCAVYTMQGHRKRRGDGDVFKKGQGRLMLQTRPSHATLVAL